MNILVIGGSYFLGRWFVEYARKEHNITVLNRGNIPIKTDGVKELLCNRHDVVTLQALASEEFDCIVDFCAYAKHDIRRIVDAFGHEGCRYIFISTVDVYLHGQDEVVSEASLFENRVISGPEGEYINGKIELEQELIDTCTKNAMSFSSVRPAILYGPANYAPREAVYLNWISQAKQVIVPSDESGHFQMLYVKDAALGLVKLCELEKAKLLPAYNFCPEEISTYRSFVDCLHKISPVPFEEIPLTLDEIFKKQIPLPFPLTREESNIYSGDRLKDLGINCTSLLDGMNAFSFQ